MYGEVVKVVTDTWMSLQLKQAFFAAMLLLVACAPRQSAQYADVPTDAHITPVFVATQRNLSHTGPNFGNERPKGLHFFRADVSIPPNHEAGKIEWPKGAPDAATDFVLASTQIFGDQNDFAQKVWRQNPGHETLVFVHGYNNTLSEAMYRFAQMRTDFNSPLPGVLFSWPSAGDARGYIYDRDSVLYSRDDLEQVLKALIDGPGERIFLVAHSIGAHLVMEVLRQAALRGDHRLLQRVSGVVLMSPDLDPDVFRRQVEAIGILPQPFLIFVSQEDRALTFASFLSGRKPRLGVINEANQLADLDVQVIDFTGLGDGSGLDHFTAATSPAAISILKGMTKQAQNPSAQFRKYMVLKTQP